MRKPKNTNDNYQHYDHSSEGNGGQIHNVVMGFAPALWVFSHLNSQPNGKMAGAETSIARGHGMRRRRVLMLLHRDWSLRTKAGPF